MRPAKARPATFLHVISQPSFWRCCATGGDQHVPGVSFSANKRCEPSVELQKSLNPIPTLQLKARRSVKPTRTSPISLCPCVSESAHRPLAHPCEIFVLIPLPVMMKTEELCRIQFKQMLSVLLLFGSTFLWVLVQRGVWAEEQPGGFLQIIKGFFFFPLAVANQFVFWRKPARNFVFSSILSVYFCSQSSPFSPHWQ